MSKMISDVSEFVGIYGMCPLLYSVFGHEKCGIAYGKSFTHAVFVSSVEIFFVVSFLVGIIFGAKRGGKLPMARRHAVCDAANYPNIDVGGEEAEAKIRGLIDSGDPEKIQKLDNAGEMAHRNADLIRNMVAADTLDNGIGQGFLSETHSPETTSIAVSSQPNVPSSLVESTGKSTLSATSPRKPTRSRRIGSREMQSLSESKDYVYVGVCGKRL
jgi:hypothetical protein